jgi:hypothetical protein
MVMLPNLRDLILAAKRTTREVEVPEWGVTVAIRELSLAERASLIQHVVDNEKAREAYLTDQALPKKDRKNLKEVKHHDHVQVQLMAGLVNPETNEPIFSLDDFDTFQSLGYVTTQKLLKVFLELNMYRDDKTAEDLKKTSD